MVNTMQQVGGSIGTALLSSIFASAVTAYAANRPHTPEILSQATVHGYTVAFWVAAGIFAVGALVVGGIMRSIHLAGRNGPSPRRNRWPHDCDPQHDPGHPRPRRRGRRVPDQTR